MIKYQPFFLILLFAGSLAYGQNKQEYTDKYFYGKEKFHQEEYQLAMQILKPVLIEDKKNPYVTYANFYYALAAYKSGELSFAKTIFEKIKRNYPTWGQIGEVNYWLTIIFFERGDYTRALTNLQQDQVFDRYRKEANKMEAQYLAEVHSIDTLEKWHQMFPQDTILARTLARKMAGQSFREKDIATLEGIIEQYDLRKSKFSLASQVKSVKKASYNIALLLPFMFDEENPTNTPSGFVMDLYRGLQQAVGRLKEEKGVSVNLYAYDTQKDGIETASVLALPEFKGMDMIIGPLYPEPTRLASEYAYKNQVYMFNPLSSNRQVIDNNPFAYLMSSTYTSLSETAADFVDSQKGPKNAMVFFSDASKDSSQAAYMIEELANKEIEVLLSQKLPKGDEKQIFKTLTAEAEPEDLYLEEEVKALKDEEKKKKHFIIPRNAVGNAIVITENDLIAANIISAAETRGDNMMVLGDEGWLSFRFLSYEQLERLNIYLLAPHHIDYSSKAYQSFKSTYIDIFKTLPSKYSITGYDMMMFVGKMLDKYGTHFFNYSEELGFIPGELYEGYNYANSQDNRYIPIIHFFDGELKVANKK